jgi:hypothetical protein
VTTRARKLLLLPVLMSLLLLSACARLSIEPPGPSNQTLLVLPTTHTNKAQRVRHAFYYVYEISSEDRQVDPYRVVIKFPVEGNILIVNSLPPGEYSLSKFIFLPRGTGDHTYGNNSQNHYLPFTLTAGEITIFNQSLNLLTYNATAGRGSSTSYKFDIEPVTGEQRHNILLTLGELKNFDSWKVGGY